MYRLRWFLIGASSLVAVGLLAGVLVLSNAHGFSARERPTAVKRGFRGLPELRRFRRVRRMRSTRSPTRRRLPATQRLSDGELFYVIENGVRLTAMPGWGGGSAHDTQDSWKLVHFIRHLPQLTEEEKAEMKKLNPKSPDEMREEQEEEDFLRGDNSHEKPNSHHGR